MTPCTVCGQIVASYAQPCRVCKSVLCTACQVASDQVRAELTRRYVHAREFGDVQTAGMLERASLLAGWCNGQTPTEGPVA